MKAVSKADWRPSTADGTNADEAPKPPPDWDRCHAYNARKRRFCRQRPLQLRVALDSSSAKVAFCYCGNHQHLALQQSTSQPNSDAVAATSANGLLRKRVPCPIDPSHSIYEDKVKKHIKNCPFLTKQREQEAKDYYVKGMNLGGYGVNMCYEITDASSTTNTAEALGEQEALQWAQRVALRVLQVHQRMFANGGDAVGNGIDAPIDPTCITFQDILSAIKMEDYSNISLNTSHSPDSSNSDADATMSPATAATAATATTLMQGLEHDMEFYRVRSGGARHVPQLASLAGHFQHVRTQLHRSGNARDDDAPTPKSESIRASSQPPLLLLEMGAGRGIFGITAAGMAAKDSMVESHDVATPRSDLNQSQQGATQHPANVHLAMVERAGTRAKAETILRNVKKRIDKAQGNGGQRQQKMEDRMQLHPTQNNHPTCIRLDRVGWSRISCDIAHVNLETVLDKHRTETNAAQNPSAKPTVIVIAKHLCGVGTDLALKAMQPIATHVDGCVLATCCHGVCNWNDYVGRDYLRSIMVVTSTSETASANTKTTTAAAPSLSSFGAREFDLLRKWSAGTVVVDASSDENGQQHPGPEEADSEHPNAVSQLEESGDPTTGQNMYTGVSNIVKTLDLKCGVQGLGRACQRLIDYGRQQYMEHVLFASSGSIAGKPMMMDGLEQHELQPQQKRQEQAAAVTAEEVPHDDDMQPTTKRPRKQDAREGKRSGAKLSYYVPASVTPQNAVLVGVRRPST